MAVGDMLRAAEDALREYAVYLSYDVDAAVKRGEDELAATLRDRFTAAHQLGDELHATNPDTVLADSRRLSTVRALAAELTHNLARLEPTRQAVIFDTAAELSKVSSAVGKMTVMVSAVAYLRVSTEGQVDKGFGLEVQEAAVKEWAKREKVRLVAIERDEGRSGLADVIDRPGLAAALGHVQSGRAQLVIVPRLDRLARDLVLQEWVRAELLKLGGQLRSADRVEDLHLVEDPDNPTGTLVRQILGAVAQYERSMIRLRMSAGKERKRAGGGYTGGKPPYGYGAAGGELVPVVDEQRTLARMRRWRRAGKSYREIADRLNAEGVPARSGGQWHPAAIGRILDRAGPKAS